MTEKQANAAFKKYNPAEGVVRCPSGRAKVRKSLDAYARATVNLYGVISCSEFVGILNTLNEEKTSAGEVYTLLLPIVLKDGWYCFYKEYLVHYAIFHDFDYVDYLVSEQGDKPRYIPEREEFLKFLWDGYDDSNHISHWKKVRDYMVLIFGMRTSTIEGFAEIRNLAKYGESISEIGEILDRHKLFMKESQAQKFFDLLVRAKNNTRIWVNKGYSPNEMAKLLSPPEKEEGITIHKPKKVGQNDPCPCGSGKKYKKCCKLIEANGIAQLSHEERRLFYETWYKLLDYINKKLDIVEGNFSLRYPDWHDETELHKIREKLWSAPKLIAEFIENDNSLSDREVSLLQSWKKKHIKGKFMLMKYEPEFAVIMQIDEGAKSKLYAVKGMTTSIAESMHRRLPVMLETVLLPFEDKIIYDSFIASHSIEFGDGMQKMLAEEYAKAKDEFGIISKL